MKTNKALNPRIAKYADDDTRAKYNRAVGLFKHNHYLKKGKFVNGRRIATEGDYFIELIQFAYTNGFLDNKEGE